MSWLRVFVHRLGALFRKGRLERELEEEIRTHLEMEAEELERRGMSAEEARYAALRSFGGVEQVKERYRERRGLRLVEEAVQDIRYGVRVLGRSRGFTSVAVVTLALGIGANTAIFSVVNAVLFKPLPYSHPDQLVMVWENHQARGGPEREWASPAGFSDWREQNGVFQQMAALNDWGPSLTGEAEPEQLVGAAVSHDMFKLLGVEPSQGRSFRPEEDQTGAGHVVILSHDLWQRRFGSDPAIIGKTLTLNGDGYTVIGVMPASFRFPIISNAELWGTLRPTLNPSCQRGCLVIRVIARLKPDTTLARAKAAMNTIARRQAEQYPESNAGVGVTLVPLHEQLVGNVRPALLLLLSAVGFVLLIACANVANLLLARAAARQREIAIRTALGATRLRLVRQLLTESLLLAMIGGAIGLLLAVWLVGVMVASSPAGTPRVEEVAIDGGVLGFTLGLTLLTGIAFGLAPAAQISKPDLNRTLKDGGKGTQSRAGGPRLRGALIVTEVALALMLLVGAGLLLKSFVLLQRVDPGFNPHNVLRLRIALPKTRYLDPQQIVTFYGQLLDRLKAIPGVQAVGATSTLPLSGNNTDTSFVIEGRPQPAPDQGPVAWYSSVSPEYFRTMGMRLIRGREFTEQDNEQSPPVVIISESMAHRYWPGEEAVGKRIGSGRNSWREIIGIMADVKHFGLERDARPTMYLPARQSPARAMSLVVRTAGEPSGVAAAVRAEVLASDKNLAVFNVGTMEGLVSTSIAQPRFVLLLLGSFADLALVLAAVGIYGVMSYMVTARTHEIGIRMALGAQAGDVLRMVLKQGMLLTLIGVVAGLGTAFAITRLMIGLLYGVSATDPAIFAGMTVMLAVVALLACYIPARRATKVDPMVALRYE